MPWRRLSKSHTLQSKTSFENVYHNIISKLFHGWNPLEIDPCFPRIRSSNFNTLRPRQNGRHSPDDTFKRIFVNENARILIEISLKFVPKGPINNIPASVQIMAWRRPGDKPLSEQMMVSLLTHICVTRPQWVNVPRHSKICQIEVTSIDNGSILISIWHWLPHFPPRYMKKLLNAHKYICGMLFSQNLQETTGWKSTMVYFIFRLLLYKYHHGNVFNVEAIDVITRRLLWNATALKLMLRIDWILETHSTG